MKLVELLLQFYSLAQLLASRQNVTTDRMSIHRDRQIGLQCQQKTPTEKLLYWHQQVLDEDLRTRIGSLGNKLRLALYFLAVGCLILGWSSGKLAFHYDGSHPINLFPLLGLFAILPFTLLAPLVFIFVPIESVPILSSLQNVIIKTNPGQFLRLLCHAAPNELREILQTLKTKSHIHLALFGSIEKFALIILWQLLTLCFLVGVIFSGLYQTLTSDLAFCWNLTPQGITSDTVHSAITWLSLPWAWAVPEAVPTLQMVDESRYYKLTDPALLNPQILAQWWSFVLLTMTTWGALPRLLTTLLGMAMLEAKVRKSLPRIPGALDLLDRLEHSHIETSAQEPSNRTEQQHSRVRPDHEPRHTTTRVAIFWNLKEFNVAELASLMPRGSYLATYIAPEEITPQTLVDELEKLDNDFQIFIMVKAWEPPLEEFFDFIRAIREDLINLCQVQIVLLDIPEGAHLQLCQEHQVWETSIKKLADPWVFAYNGTNL
jgi:hypothetical protein